METNNVAASTTVLDASTSAVGSANVAAGDALAAWHPFVPSRARLKAYR